MHDIQYRMHVAYQNDCYNQPTHLSYYLGFDTENVPVPQIYTVGNNEKNPDLAKKSWNINDLYSGEKVELVLDTPTALHISESNHTVLIFHHPPKVMAW